MTVEPLKLGFSRDEFTTYCDKLKMGAWRPRGCVLHNTYLPTLAMVNGYLTSGRWRFDQLIDNWWVRYKKLKWSSGPHLFIMPDKIWVATPLPIKGTHSPSFNSAYWGVELVGDYSTETLPKALRDNAVHAMACLFSMLGHEPSPQTLKFHGEDPRTSHKGCPGKNVGPKSQWEADIEKRMAELNPGEHFTD
jgi:hypothetical protein